MIYFEGEVGSKIAYIFLFLFRNDCWHDSIAILKENFGKAVLWFEKVTNNDDNKHGIIQDGTLYLIG